MTTIFTWSISELECLPVAPETNLPNCVWVVHWNCTASSDQINPDTNKPYTASRYGTVRLTYDSSETYIPYEELTESQVISWVQEIMNQNPESDVSSLEQGLSTLIQNQMNPPSIQPALPW